VEVGEAVARDESDVGTEPSPQLADQLADVRRRRTGHQDSLGSSRRNSASEAGERSH
jgi:hypothetical protein